MIGWIALAITVLVFVPIALRIDDWGRDWTKNMASLEADAKRDGLRPVELDCDVPEAQSRLRRWVQSQPNWDIVAEDPPGESPLRLKLTRTTRLMRFVDDVEVTIGPRTDAPGVIIYATSKSRIGKGDLGQNPRNLIELTDGLRGE
ncbi:MAG: DUF1499 domain-containing protein [Planctomycetales bacterium]|nr:DUF1499 domain-containing protein [Planctomycetales bacterium]